MSQLHSHNGKVVWWPDHANLRGKAILIDPQAKPMDEVWRFIRICVAVYLTKYKAWAETKDDMDELESMCWTASYCRLLRIVRTGQYRKDLSFYLNVRSAVMGTIYHVYNYWLDELRNRSNFVDGFEVIADNQHGGNTLFDLRASETVPKLRTESEYKVEKPIESYKTYWCKVTAYRLLVDDEYLRYVEMCEDHCIEPNKFEQWFKDNYSEEDRRLYEGADDDKYKAYRRAYSARRRLRKKRG